MVIYSEKSIKMTTEKIVIVVSSIEDKSYLCRGVRTKYLEWR